MTKLFPPVCEDVFRVGVIDTGVNPWHSHVRGRVSGIHIYPNDCGIIQEDENFRDLSGHGTAVAGVLRQGLPDAELFVVRVFNEDLKSYPTLVARALLRAAAEGCRVINLSLGMPASSGAGSELLKAACCEVMAAGTVLVAAGHPERPGLLPASLPGVNGVIAADHIPPGEVVICSSGDYRYSASGKPRELNNLPGPNMWGNSFACARVSLNFALILQAGMERVESVV